MTCSTNFQITTLGLVAGCGRGLPRPDSRCDSCVQSVSMPPQPPAPLRLAVITAASHLPDLIDPDGWNEALRLRGLIDSPERGGYRIAGLLGADAHLPERLAEIAPDVVIVDAESGARDAIEHVVWATRDAPRPIVLFTDEHDPAHMREAVAAGVVAYVVAGLAPDRVRPVIDVAIARFEHEQGLRLALAQATGALRDRDV